MFRSQWPRHAIAIDCGEELVTKQAHKEECDINNILNQYKRTGIVRHVTERKAQFIDLPADLDLQNSLNVVKRAQEAFASLPAVVRDRFHNNPAEFLAAFQDEKRQDELRQLGLLQPAEVVQEAHEDTPATSS